MSVRVPALEASPANIAVLVALMVAVLVVVVATVRQPCFNVINGPAQVEGRTVLGVHSTACR